MLTGDDFLATAKLSAYEEKLSEDFHISHKISTGKSGSFHVHKDLEVVFIKTDGVVCEVSGSKIEVKANSLLFFNSSDLHRLTCPDNKPYERYVIYFKQEHIEKLSSEQTDLFRCFFLRPTSNANYIELTEEQSNELLAHVEKLLAVYSSKEEEYGHDLMMKFGIGELLIYLNRVYAKTHSIKEKSYSRSYKNVYKVIEYINQNLAEEITLSDLAKQIYTSKKNLCHLFDTVIGTSPQQYVKRCRITKAKEYLSNGYSVDETCDLSGFKNLSHFSRVFKETVGINPKKYSQNQQKSEKENYK